MAREFNLFKYSAIIMILCYHDKIIKLYLDLLFSFITEFVLTKKLIRLLSKYQKVT